MAVSLDQPYHPDIQRSRIVEVTNCGSSFWLKLKNLQYLFRPNKKNIGKVQKSPKYVHTFTLQIRTCISKTPSLAFITVFLDYSRKLIFFHTSYCLFLLAFFFFLPYIYLFYLASSFICCSTIFTYLFICIVQ